MLRVAFLGDSDHQDGVKDVLFCHLLLASFDIVINYILD